MMTETKALISELLAAFTFEGTFAGEARVTITEEATASGKLAYFDVSVLDRERQPLSTLKNARYQEATP